MINRPQPDEYADFYNTYVKLVGNEPIIDILAELKESTYKFLGSIPAEKAEYAYAEGKWTTTQVVGHMIDAERVFAYRAMRFLRNDTTNLPGFDENAFVDNADFNSNNLANLAAELRVMRESTIYLLNTVNESNEKRTGNANGRPCSVRALAYIIAGHELHHIKIFKERYL
jgi:uncharacterized damage-inducible protein DinB